LWSLAISGRTWTATGVPEQLTFGTGIEGAAVASAGGKLVFASGHPSRNLYSYSGNPSTGVFSNEPRAMTQNSVYNWFQNVSRDGRHLVYISNRSGDWALWARDLNSDQEAILHRTTDKLLFPQISPDGLTVAFYEYSMATGSGVLKLVPLGGGSARILCEPCGQPVDWTPDGSQLLVVAGRMAYPSERQ
jgi:Tol biopolymer transport system component